MEMIVNKKYCFFAILMRCLVTIHNRIVELIKAPLGHETHQGSRFIPNI